MDKPRNSRELYISLLRHVRPYWKMFALALASMVVLAATEPAMPALMKPLLDGSFIDKDPVMIRTVPLLLILIFLIRGLAGYISAVALNWVSGKVIMDLRNLMFGKLLSLPGSYYDDNPSGNVISKLIYNVDQVAQAAGNVLLIIVRDSLAVIGLLAWMIYIDWKLSLVFLLVIPTTGLVIKLVSGRLRRLSRTLQTIMGNMTHILDEAIRGNRVVKLFGGQDYEGKRFRDATNQVRQFNFKVIATSAANVPIVQLIAVIALAFIVYMSSLQSLSDKFSVGEFISFFAAMALLFSPIKRLTKINEQLYNAGWPPRNLSLICSIWIPKKTPAPNTSSKSGATLNSRMSLSATEPTLSTHCKTSALLLNRAKPLHWSENRVVASPHWPICCRDFIHRPAARSC